MGLFARWTVCLLTYPLNPPKPVIPLRDFDRWTYFKVKLSQPLVFGVCVGESTSYRFPGESGKTTV